MNDWTPEAIRAEMELRESFWKRGVCPDSGHEIHDCHRSICDCFGAWDCKVCPSTDT